MELHTAIYLVGSGGFFPSRAFIPAFVTALILRFGGSIPGVSSTDLIHLASTSPTWFTSDLCLWSLGILSALEWWATKDPDLRQFMHEFDHYAKSMMFLLTSFGVLTASDAKVAGAILGLDVGTVSMATAVAGGVFYAATLRRTVYDTLIEMDPDDSVGLQRLASWIEDSWIVFGLFLFFIFPIFILVVSGIVLFSLFLIARGREQRENSLRIKCTKCQQPVLPSAFACPSCKTALKSPCAIDFLGSIDVRTKAGADHRLRLIEHRRCPRCAELFHRTSFDCAACGTSVFRSPAEVQAYMAYVDARLWKVFLVCGLTGLVPVIAAIPGIVYYRLALVAPYRRYVPLGGRVFTRWAVRICNLFILSFHIIPIFGGVALALMAFISYSFWKSSFQSAIATKSPSTVPSENVAFDDDEVRGSPAN